MAEKVSLAVQKRHEVGSSAAGRLRAKGILPGVVYGKNFDPINIMVSARDLHELLSKHGRNAVLELDIEGQKLTAIIKDLQHNLAGNRYEHVDFQRIALDKPIKAVVPIRLHGEGIVESKGGLLMLQLDKLEVECLPDLLPEVIELDISALDVGQSLKVADINVPDGVQVLSPPDEVVVVVTETRGEAVQEAETQENDNAEES